MQSPIFPAGSRTAALWGFARTPRGQLAGLMLVAVPALVGPLPVDGAARAGVGVLAVLAGTAGAVLVFGGLLTRVYGPALERLGRGVPLLWALAAALLVAAGVALVAGTRGDWDEHAPEVLMFALPAVAAAGAAWRAGRGESVAEGPEPEHDRRNPGD
ncbi:hypothetical protein ACIB24_19675 [Spongisporangium articulatum]|uniref:Uncharacterized protein n=1 Tax=Spongisporangium articulatum TaxID=3362603 RepID=A0ABW8AUH1_9ACTN